MARGRRDVAALALEAYWYPDDARAVVEAWRLSGEPQAAFARRHRIDPKRLGRWVRRLSARPPSKPRKRTRSRASGAVEFYPIRVTGASETGNPGGATIEIELPGGNLVRVPAGVAESDLRTVLTALKPVGAVGVTSTG